MNTNWANYATLFIVCLHFAIARCEKGDKLMAWIGGALAATAFFLSILALAS